jgi:hypothetical protein
VASAIRASHKIWAIYAGQLPGFSRFSGWHLYPDQLVIRREYSVVAMPVLPRRRDEIGEPVKELIRREFDDAVGPRPR